MRICVVTVAGYVHGIGGMQDHTVDLVRGLVAAGHEVEVITARHPEGVKEAEFAGALWHFVDAPTSRRYLPMRHPAWLRSSAVRFGELQARRPFDVVHSESTSALGLLHRNWHKRVTIVPKFHGNYFSFVRTALRRIAAREDVVAEAKGILWNTGAHFLTSGWYAFRSCEAMVASRAQLQDTVRSLLLRSSSVHVVPNGIDAARFAPGDREVARAELGLRDGIIFVWLGRIYAGKGLDVAIHGLARAGIDASLLVVGDGEGRAKAEAIAASAGLREAITFAGLQPRERIPVYLRSADALVFPTLLPEAAPMTPLQAMASGIPVLASRIGAIPELVGMPGVNGLLVEPGDVDELASNMARLAGDDRLRARVGAAGRERVLSEYTLERMIEKTLAVYDVARARFQGAPSKRVARCVSEDELKQRCDGRAYSQHTDEWVS
jgi:glycosyltransferase involved in cell wall biosynthesis